MKLWMVICPDDLDEYRPHIRLLRSKKKAYQLRDAWQNKYGMPCFVIHKTVDESLLRERLNIGE